MRATLVFTLGAMGEEDDLQRFMELMNADMEIRAHRVVDKLFSGRIQLIPAEESFEDDDLQEPAGSPS
jgi:predicted ATP-dependent Lon-type protease